MKQVFISSVQKEFERERAAIKKMIESDPILKPNFKAFVFEIDASASDKSTQQVYLKEIEKSDIYLLLVGNKYGYCKEGEVSPTEQEFDKAQELGLTKLVFVRGTDNSKRDEREKLFLDKVSRGRVRVRYQDSEPEQAVGELLDEVRNSLRDIMLDDGILSEKPFEDQAIAFISRHLNHGAGAHSHGAAADDVDEIPNSVIAEAVNNAIAHRNYASIGSIQVEVYSDRVEVISPGRLHRAITVTDLYKKHESFATNPRIARAMYQVKYIETIGTGLTDLLKECKAKGLRKPLLEEVSGRFRIVIWRPKTVANRGGNTLKGSLKGSLKSSQKIIEVLTKDPHCTYDSLAEIIGISRRAVTKQIQRLRQSGRLRRIGPDKGGHWEILPRQV